MRHLCRNKGLTILVNATFFFLSFASGTKSELSIIRRVVPSESDHKKNSVAAFGRLPHARIELKGVSSEERSTTFGEKNYFMRFVSYDMWSFI